MSGQVGKIPVQSCWLILHSTSKTDGSASVPLTFQMDKLLTRSLCQFMQVNALGYPEKFPISPLYLGPAIFLSTLL